jgi:flavin-dependent dehydrogenase
MASEESIAESRAREVTQTDSRFDVVVVGASIAGCTAARLYALQGLREALVEQHRNADTYKQLCTHFIQSSAFPTIRKLGLEPVIERLGGVRNGAVLWTDYGWTREAPPRDKSGNVLYGYNIRRLRLDPALRELAAQTPGVTALFGCAARALVREQRLVTGVEIGGQHSGALGARLIVAADGRNSHCAELAQVATKSSPNCRAFALRAYRNVPLRRGECSQMWFAGDDTAYVFPNDEGVTVVGYMPHQDTLAAFRADPNTALEQGIARLPDAPDLKNAQLLGPTLLVKDYPNLWRPAVANGMALIGDAAMSTDPLWGVGCGFAFQMAHWLVDCTSGELLAQRTAREGLKRYAKTVARQLGGHRFLIAEQSRRRRLNAIERLMFSAAAKDEGMARHLHAFGSRLIGPARFLAPSALLRAAWINLRAAPAPLSSTTPKSDYNGVARG